MVQTRQTHYRGNTYYTELALPFQQLHHHDLVSHVANRIRVFATHEGRLLPVDFATSDEKRDFAKTYISQHLTKEVLTDESN